MTTAALIALSEISFTAMGTDVRVLVPADSAPAVTRRVREMFLGWDARLSRFRDDSELSALNASSGTAFTASPLLFGVMRSALAAARATDGAFDPAMGSQLRALGYDRPFREITRLVDATAATHPGGAWRRIVLNAETRAITVPVGTQIDLGGIAKGMAVDAAIAVLRHAGVSTALVSAGGDLRVVGRPPVHEDWGITLPEAGERTVALSRGALATSTTSGRRWVAGDEERHHLLDPATGHPANSGTRAVTVAARTCAQAEVAAKAALVLGPLGGAALLRRLGLSGLVTPTTGSPLAVGRWPGEDSPWT